MATTPTPDPVTPPAHAPSLPTPVTTERLRLRAATADDAETTWPYRRLPEVNEWINGPEPDLAAYTAHFRDPRRLGDTIIVELRTTDSPVVVGDLMLRISDAWAQSEVTDRARRAQAEVGWALDPTHSGHGYATEAVQALLRHCFSTLGIHRITAVAFANNEASWRLMERVGMRRESLTRQDALHRSLGWLDSVGYALLADEWTEPPVGRLG
ncbi:GNAT family N-acetyltransferase [Kribbia dieselivorans]|uniref:GNAT family N-acetyltransferase n=1 Tax=Kribbia dieselivorans TaxID=331526 RepID=UPI001FE2391E|nr:GNAT family protein [Kribbia dieselivorans]